MAVPMLRNLNRSITRTLADGLKTLNLNQGNWVDTDFPGNVYSSWTQHGIRAYHVPGEHLNYEALVGPLYYNSAYMACIRCIIDAFAEAPPCVKVEGEDGKPTVDPNHPLLPLFQDLGHDEYDYNALWSVALVDYFGHGNGYILKMDTNGGRTIALRYAPWCRMKPVPNKMPNIDTPMLNHYEYIVGINRYIVPVENVINLQWGADPEVPWLGLGRGDSLLRDIFQDNEAGSYVASMLRNWGLAGKIVSPKDVDSARDFDGETLVKLLAAQTKGEKRGSSIAFDRPLDIFEPSTSPEKMALDKIRQYPESRICAALGVPGMVAGLQIGHTQKTYSNYAEARAALWEDTIQPTMGRFSVKLTRDIIRKMPEYKTGVTFDFDARQVAALQEDQHKIKATAVAVFESGLWDAARALIEIGDEPKPEDNGRMYQGSQSLTEGQVLRQVNTAKAYDTEQFDLEAWIGRIETERKVLAGMNGVH